MEENLFSLMLVLGFVSFVSLIRSKADLLWSAAGALLGIAGNHLWLETSVRQASLLLATCCALVLSNAVNRRGGLLLAGVITYACHARLAADFPVSAQCMLILLFPLLLWLVLHHRGFRDNAMVDEALTFVMFGGLALGLASEVMEGWRSAAALHGLDADVGTGTIQLPGVWVSGACVLAGVFYKRWKYR